MNRSNVLGSTLKHTQICTWNQPVLIIKQLYRTSPFGSRLEFEGYFIITHNNTV